MRDNGHNLVLQSGVTPGEDNLVLQSGVSSVDTLVLHHVATLLGRQLGLRAHVASVARRLRLVRLQRDTLTLKLSLVAESFKAGQRKTSARLIFLGLKWSVKERKVGGRQAATVLRTRMNKGLASLSLCAIKFSRGV